MTPRVALAALALLFGTLPLEERASGSEEGRRADVEFSLSAGASAADRAQVAIELWRTGVIESVGSPRRDGGFYRVYLKKPHNIFHMFEVHSILEDQDAIAEAASIVGWLVDRTDR